MKRLLTILALCASLSLPTLSEAKTHVQLGCSMTAPGYVPGNTAVECTPESLPSPYFSNFPYNIPAGQTLCVTDFVLVNKFPYDPPEYHTAMRTMYGLFYGISVSAHAPYLHLITPMAYPSTTYPVFRAWVLNGMSEPQNTYLYVFGFLTAGACVE